MNKIIEEISKFVWEECNKSTSKYGSEPYRFHFIPVVNYAKQLAEKKGVDLEIVELAAWLHDIGSIIYGRKDHHITGARIAEEKLKELNYPEEKIKLIKKCILNHRGSREDSRETKEEKIIAEADAMSNFDNIAGIFKAAYIFENQTQGEAMKSTKKKLQNKYNQISEENKKLIKPKYDAAMLLLREE